MNTTLDDWTPPARLTPSERTLQDLKWARVLERLAWHCATEAGAERARATPIYAREDDVRAELARVSEVRLLLDRDSPPPFAGVHTLTGELDRAGKEGLLTREPILKVADTLHAAVRLFEFFEDREDDCPRTWDIASKIPDLSELAHVLHTTFDPGGQIRDDASPRLADLRRRLHSTSARVRSRLESYLSSHESDEVLQDSYYTIREGRYVLPVKSSMKPTFSGIIHGSSQTGATVFVEPESLIPLNNELKLLVDAVEREEYLVLRDRTERIVRSMPAILETARLLAELDHVTARAKLATAMGAAEPAINVSGETVLQAARNPHLLLKGTDVVPNDIPLRGRAQLMVITGPNTGGKSVTLSTFGLCTLMTMAGMHIPAGPDSTVSLFERIDTVFGDPQSIEQDLSTFSGHLKLLGEVLETCSDRSLLLMDEIVVGTEPTGGSALAIAVLEALADRGARGLVTTHYDRLKTMALADPRFQNASVGIDVRTMTPTYRLAIGTPGSSSPIEMAKKLGMNPGVLARATELVGSQTQELQSALAALDRERSELEHARDEARAEKERLRAAQKELEAERARMRQKGLEIARELQKEVLGELAKARDVARDAIAALQREKQPVRIEEQRRRVERAATQVRSAVATAEGAKEAAAPSATPLEPGDFERLAEGTGVFVLSLGRRGTLVRKPENRRKIEVLVGRARMTTEVDNLAWPPESPEAKKPLRPTLTPAEAAKVAPPVAVGDDAPPRVPSYTVDLRGMRVDEALDEVVRRFDAAMMEGKNALYLIHGHGSGVLKTAIRELCEKTRYVRRWRQGERDEGGDGVTVAFLEG